MNQAVAADNGVSTDGVGTYDLGVVKLFTIAAVIWGAVALSVGVYIAFQLAFPVLNLDLEWFSFGRLRPLHTSGAIFGFGGCALIGTSLLVVQKTCRAPLWGGVATGRFIFWGYQMFIVMAAYLLGLPDVYCYGCVWVYHWSNPG